MQNVASRIGSVVLTLGASLVLGLLSFAGFYAIFPIVPLAMSSFFLATVYEGQIYHQNITDALTKLFQKSYFKQLRSNQLIDALIQKYEANLSQQHDFFREYKELSKYIDALAHQHHRSKAQEVALKEAKKRLALMQQYFMKTLFEGAQSNSDYAKTLRAYLESLEKDDALDINDAESIAKTSRHTARLLQVGLGFSVLAGAFVGIGTGALLFESLPILQEIHMLHFLAISSAAMPYAVVPFAVLAAAGYFYLTYNSLSDMIYNDTLRKWYQEVRKEMKESSPVKAITLAVSSVLLVAMTVSLAVFTAGTWWTVVKSNPRILKFLTRVPHLITAVLVTIFGGLSQVVFGLENIKETMDTIRGAFSTIKAKNFLGAIKEILTKPWILLAHRINHAWDNEPLYQFFNPFRFIINVVETPIRILGFLAHITSIGATADRVPGVPALLSAIIAAIEELFEDAHYFTDNEGEKHVGHGHSNDIPTKLIKFCMLPLHGLSILWLWGASLCTQKPLSINDATDLEFHDHHIHEHEHTQIENPKPSQDFQKESVLMQLKEKEAAYQKTSKGRVYTTLREKTSEIDAAQLNAESFKTTLSDTKVSYQHQEFSIKGALAHNRYLHWHTKTSSETFVDEVADSLTAAPAC